MALWFSRQRQTAARLVRSSLRFSVRGESAVMLLLLYSTSICLAPLRGCESDRRLCGRHVLLRWHEQFTLTHRVPRTCDRRRCVLFRRLHERFSSKMVVLMIGDGFAQHGNP